MSLQVAPGNPMATERDDVVIQPFGIAAGCLRGRE